MALLERVGRSSTRTNSPPVVPVRSSPVDSSTTVNQLAFRARLSDRWVTGSVTTVSRRLLDVLNSDDNDGLLLAEAVLVDEQGTPARYGVLNVANALFVVPRDDAGAPPRDSFSYVRKRPERVRLGIESYEIVGDFHRAEEVTLRNTHALATLRFLVLTSAEVWQRGSPRVHEHYAAVFVNRKRLDFLMPLGDE